MLIAALGTLFTPTLEAKDASIKYEGYIIADPDSVYDCGFNKNRAILEITGNEYTLTTEDALGPITVHGEVNNNLEISNYINWNVVGDTVNSDTGELHGRASGGFFDGRLFAEITSGTGGRAGNPAFCSAKLALKSVSGHAAKAQINAGEKSAVTKPKPAPAPRASTSTSGSGFFVSKTGHVITNQHVVGDCAKVTVGDEADKQVEADILEMDIRNDLALLKIASLKMASAETKSLIQNLGLAVVPLASEGLLRSDDVDLGEDVLVAGYP